MKTILKTDIAIIGGGAAGIAAAIAAANANKKVILFEQNNYLGGNATAAEVGTICGLYHFQNNKNSQFIVSGFVKEFALKIQNLSNSTPLQSSTGLHYLPYNIQVFKDYSFHLLKEKNVQLFLNTKLLNVKISEKKINVIEVECENQILQIELKSVVDCSGNSIVSQLAKLPLIESKIYQAAAQIFVLKNVIATNEHILGLSILKALSAAIYKNELPSYFDRVYVVNGSLKNDEVSLKIGIPLVVTNTNENTLELKRISNNFIVQLIPFLIKNIPAFEKASLKHIAPEVGTRVGFRTFGKYLLNKNDVLNAKKFKDAIAQSSWPIEIWEQNKRVNMQYLSENQFYQIPVRCIQSKFVNNLFAAGKNISANDEAIASARVIGTCLQTGYAAGCLAANIITNKSVNEIVKDIQKKQLN